MKTVSSTDLKQSLGDVLAAAGREPVAITRHGKPRYVVVSVETWDRLSRRDPRQAHTLDDAPDDHIDMLHAAVTAQLAELDRD